MYKSCRYLFVLPLLWLAACSSVPPSAESSRPTSWSDRTPVPSTIGSALTPVPVTSLPEWPQQQFGAALSALKQSCRVMVKQPRWSVPCQSAERLATDDSQAIRQFFESGFTAWKMQDGTRDTGLITGYYEPALSGSRMRTSRASYPVYGVPADLFTLNIPASMRGADHLVARKAGANRLVPVSGALEAGAGQVMVSLSDFPAGNRSSLKGRIENNRFYPYYTRAEIAEGRGVSQAPVLAWVEDPVALFFLQIQGAGRIQLDDGSLLRVGVGDNNGYGYKSIGSWLAEHGEMPLSAASMSGIQNWVHAHPERQQALFNVNPRYIFFRAQPAGNNGPVGALGVPLTDGYSIAVDPRYIPLGAPVFLSTTWPGTQQALHRLVNAQDTGSAIRGALRVDFFWGYGEQAGQFAGRMKQSGSLWLLLPNGVLPS
jgi:membrane-bound lytic murein transglycosylase A